MADAFPGNFNDSVTALATPFGTPGCSRIDTMGLIALSIGASALASGQSASLDCLGSLLLSVVSYIGT